MKELSKKIQNIKKRTAALLMSATILITGTSCHENKSNLKPSVDPDKSVSQDADANQKVDDNIIIDSENAWGGGQASLPEDSIDEEKQPEITPPSVTPEGSLDAQKPLKSNEEIAKEVIRGLWGNGLERIESLTASGYDYVAIQDLVNAIIYHHEIVPEIEEHHHEFGNWIAVNDLEESRTCACGATETRPHDYEISTFKNIPDYPNNTYEQIITETCTTCSYTHEKSTICEMTFTPWYYDNYQKLDLRDCIEFNYSETRNHEHKFKILSKTDENYEYWSCDCGLINKIKHNFTAGTPNKDGSTTYNCTNDLCNYSKTKTKPSPSHSSSSSETHIHNYTEFVSSTDEEETWKCPQDDATIKKPHGIFHFLRSLKELGEEWLCDTCNHKKTISHNLTYHIEDDTKVYTCTTPECDYTYTETLTPSHTHNYTEYVSSTDEEETWKCPDDGMTITKPHNLSLTGTYNRATNEVEYNCLNDSCDYKKKVLHTDHTYKIDNEQATRAHEILVCEICGDSTTKAHEFNNGIEEKCIVTYSCNHEDCTYSYQEENHDYDADISYYNNDPTYCYRKTETCSKCGDTIETDVEHDWQKKNENPFGYDEYCTRNGNCHVTDKEISFLNSIHTLEEQIIIPNLEIKEETTISKALDEKIEEYQTEEELIGFNIYYKTPTLPLEDKPLTLIRKKRIEMRGTNEKE